MVLTPKEPMSEKEKLWWAMCITANRFRFGFGRQANRTLKSLFLPEASEMPAWVNEASIDKYTGAERAARQGTSQGLDVSAWKSFSLQDLFDIRKGQRLTKLNMLPGQVPYVGASDRNNGVTAFIGQEPIHSGGTISVSYNGSVAEAFYQPVAFWATDDVNVLYPKGFALTPETALFICTVIRLEKYRFSYGRKWHLDRMRESIIRLPATATGQADWDVMQSSIEQVPFSSQLSS